MSFMVTLSAWAFLGMGVLALVAPASLASLIGRDRIDRDDVSEIRAVYGGFSLVMAVLLAGAEPGSRFAPGILLTVGMALLGMAAGRVVAMATDGRPSWRFVVFLLGEVVFGAALLHVAGRTW